MVKNRQESRFLTIVGVKKPSNFVDGIGPANLSINKLMDRLHSDHAAQFPRTREVIARKSNN